jgi:solute carrier family 25 (peroxisomal adenine nucleotide transporter), member 17
MASPPIVHAVAGALGSSLSIWLLYPLERARIELQRSSPLKGTTNDHDPTNAGCDTDDGEVVEVVFEAAEEESWQDALAETSGAVPRTDSMAMDPLVVACQHRSTDDSTTIANCIQRLRKNQVLYQGVSTIVLTTGISNFVFFYLNELLKQVLAPPDRYRKVAMPVGQRHLVRLAATRPSPGRALLASFLAGICNVCITNPFWVANMNLLSSQHSNHNTNESSCAALGLFTELQRIVKEKGWTHLWAGTGASLLLVSNPILQFFVYEELKSRRVFGPVTNSSVCSFVNGALAKFVATVATYPFQLSQTIMRSDDTYKSTWDCIITLYRQNGYRVLFRGIKAKLLQTVLTAAFTFLTYEQIVSALTSIVGTLQHKETERRMQKWP